MIKRTKMVIILILAFVVLFLMVLLSSLRSEERERGQTQNPSGTIPVPEPLPPVVVPAVLEPAPEGPVAQNVRVVAADFAERYGSFSTDGNYQNLRDLFTQMTTGMRANTEAFIARDPLHGSEFMGVTTHAVRTEVLAQTDSTARITVATQRVETKVGAPDRIFYETAELALVKDGLRWLVDTFEWARTTRE